MNFTSLNSNIGLVISAGIIATTGMTALALSLVKLRTLTISSIQAVGSLVTGTKHVSTPLGFGIHFLVGIIFSFIYFTAFQFIGAKYGFQYLYGGVFFGLLHGIITASLIIVSIGEHHPIHCFRPIGLITAVAYVAAHMFYGFLLGLVFMIARGVTLLPIR